MHALDSPGTPLVDLAFPLVGSGLPRDHRALLAAALRGRLPWLGDQAGTGPHQVNVVTGDGARALLSARARLLLRVPRNRVEDAGTALAEADLQVGDDSVHLGRPVQRALLPHRTLYAYFVAAPEDDEALFLARVDAELHALGVVCRPVCGRRQSLASGSGELPGFSLMLDGLNPADALRVLQTGVGSHRGLGCGLFVPHRSAAAVGSGS
jgi:CRISPR-associated protein Cas6